MHIVQKIHFIRRVDMNNTGDRQCCPLSYYYDFFKDYNILAHDIEHIKWREISAHDIVIIGGGGLLCSDSFINNINLVLDRCPNVIGWGIGFNRHYDTTLKTSVNTDKFKLLGIRDYNLLPGAAWVPCVSCKGLYFEEPGAIKRKIGIIEHTSFKTPQDLSYEKMDNSENFETLVDFINSSEVILSTSYHMIYWAILLGKKTICVNPFSEKFEYFKYKPAFYSGDLDKDISAAQIHKNALKEAVKINDEFFEKVKEIISSVIRRKDNSYQKIFEMNNAAYTGMQLDDFENRTARQIGRVKSILQKLGLFKPVKYLMDGKKTK